MMHNKDFAVFILTHGRPNNVHTYDTLLRSGYTGNIYILIDNEDETAQSYYHLYGEKVIMFDKKEIADRIDTMDNFKGRKAIIYARNANFKIAKDLGIKYFLQLDDDYHAFEAKFNKNLKYKYSLFQKLDELFDIIINFYKSVNIKSIALAQTGDFFGGMEGTFGKSIFFKRKCMNSWFLNSDNPINFIGKMNEDFTTSIYYGSLGELFFSIDQVTVNQEDTQKAIGGMSDLYANNGTYIKTFYTIMAVPSCIKVSLIGINHRRLHHQTKWENAVPKIIAEENKKDLIKI